MRYLVALALACTIVLLLFDAQTLGAALFVGCIFLLVLLVCLVAATLTPKG